MRRVASITSLVSGSEAAKQSMSSRANLHQVNTNRTETTKMDILEPEATKAITTIVKKDENSRYSKQARSKSIEPV